jgi:hypothetical protein
VETSAGGEAEIDFKGCMPFMTGVKEMKAKQEKTTTYSSADLVERTFTPTCRRGGELGNTGSRRYCFIVPAEI